MPHAQDLGHDALGLLAPGVIPDGLAVLVVLELGLDPVAGGVQQRNVDVDLDHREDLRTTAPLHGQVLALALWRLVQRSERLLDALLPPFLRHLMPSSGPASLPSHSTPASAPEIKAGAGKIPD